jgi:hypothetical protein
VVPLVVGEERRSDDDRRTPRLAELSLRERTASRSESRPDDVLSRRDPRPWRTFAWLFEGSRCLLAISLAVSIAQSLLLVPVALMIRHA